MAMIGAMMPNILLLVAQRALPVPLSFVGKTSGVYAYNTAYLEGSVNDQDVRSGRHTMIFEVKLNPQFQPNKLFEVRAVVEPYKNTPVKAVESASVPLRPNFLISTMAPPSSAPGTPSTAMIKLLRYVMYVEPSPKSKPRVAWMYGKNAL